MTDTKPRVVAEFRCGEDGGACGRKVGTLTRAEFGGDVVFAPHTKNEVEIRKYRWDDFREARCPKHGWVALIDDYALVDARARHQRGKPRTYFLSKSLLPQPIDEPIDERDPYRLGLHDSDDGTGVVWGPA